MGSAFPSLGSRPMMTTKTCFTIVKNGTESSARGGSVEDFRSMYDGVDAVVDTRYFYFWEQIHEAFPEAKVNTYCCSFE